MGRGRKLLLGALRRGRTSARADSPARTRFARVRRAHSAACSSLPMANSDQSPSSAYLRPWPPLLRPSLHLQPSCRLRVLPLFSPSHARSQPSAVTSPGPLVAAPMRSALHHHPPPFSTPWESPVSPSAAHPSTAPSPSSPTVRPATCAVPAGSVPRCRRSPHCPPHPVFQVPCHVSPSPRHPLPRRAVMFVTRNGEWRRAPRRIGAQGRRHPRRTSSPQRKPRPIPSCPASSPPEPCPLRFVPPSVVPGPRRRA